MDTSYLNFWQNAFTDMFDSSSQLKKMDELFQQSLSSFGDLTTLFQKMGNWGTFFNPMDMQLFDFRQLLQSYYKTMGMISVDEYRALVKKYEELKKKNQNVDNVQENQAKKISELNQAVKNEKKKLSTRDKTISNNKIELEELKQSATALKNDLEKTQKELDKTKQQLETMKKELSAKETSAKKKETAKA